MPLIKFKYIPSGIRLRSCCPHTVFVCLFLPYDGIRESLNTLGEQRWRSGESARFPPMCPGFDSQTRRHMWVEFVVGSRPCSKGFSPGSLAFLPPQKPTFLNSNLIRNLRATSLSVEHCCVSPSLNKVD